MEVRNGFVQFLCRKSGKKILEMPEGTGAFIEVLRLLHEVIGLGPLYKEVNTEEIIFFIFIVSFSLFRGDKA